MNDQRKDFACLDLGREIAALKVSLRECEQELQSKSLQNEKLKAAVVKTETQLASISKSLQDKNDEIPLENYESLSKTKLPSETAQDFV